VNQSAFSRLGSQFLFLLLLCAGTAFSIDSAAASLNACAPLLGSLDEKLQLIQARKIPMVFFDLDRTLGIYNDDTKTWTLFPGTIKALRKIGQSASLILYTGNSSENIRRLLSQYPELAESFSTIITADDVSPFLAQAAREFPKWLEQKKADPNKGYLRFLHEYWKETKLKLGEDIDPQMLIWEKWFEKIYLPTLAIQKSPVVKRYDGILIDDEVLADPSKQPAGLRDAIEDGQAIFYVKKNTKSEPDWDRITNYVLAKCKR